MKWTNTILSILFFLFLTSSVFAQTCEFSLELSDTYGDGWNGASVDIDIDGVITNYTLEGFPNPDPYFVSHPILVSGTQSITITYNTGFYDNEASYQLIGPLGNVVFEDGLNPLIGLAFTGEVECPSCPPVAASSVNISDVRAFSAKINWFTAADDATYSLEYGMAGFVQGDGQTVTTGNTNFILSGLMQDTDYEVYLSAVCDDGEVSTLSQPYTFKTLIAIDLGIVGVSQPLSGCGLGAMDMIQVEIHNYGGAPQTFVPFNFSINGEPGGVSHPVDGIYTGVLGIDSTDIMDFDIEYDFSEYGEYEILAWTEMEGDTVNYNDTFSFTLVNKPILSDFPFFEDFESDVYSGWSLGQEGQNQTFAYGQPAGFTISTAASGQNAWVTNLAGSYSFGEISYLDSPCYDFSGQSEDMIFDVALFVNLNFNDGMWLESSVDGGGSWTKLGDLGSGTNWYNDTSFEFGAWWSGSFTNEWMMASHTLDGLAGEVDVRFRFAFRATSFFSLEGVGIDNIFIHPELANDMSVFSGHTTGNDFCGSAADHVAVSLFNHGQNPISNIMVNYQVDDGTIVTESAAGVTLQPGEQETYTFFTPFSSIGLNGYTITIWVDGGDDNATNDITVFQSASNILAIPASENFETGALPNNWTTNGYIAGPLAHNNPSFNVTSNVYSFNPEFITTTPYFGEIGENFVFTFDYRISDYFDGMFGTVLVDDNIQIQVAPYCTEDYVTIYTIDASNHITTPDYANVSIDLTEYAGENLSFRFIATWDNGGDYWVDIDNINITSIVSANDIELVKEVSLSPNPTSDIATLNVEFLESVDAKITVSNLLGQEILTINKKNVRQGEYTLDLTKQPDGLYFVSIHAGNTVKTLKLIKS